MFEELLTERLCLRHLLPEDADSIFAYRTMSDVSRYQSWEPQSLEEVRSFIDNMSSKQFGTPGWYQIGIVLKAAGNLIGDCGIHVLETDARIVEVAISVAPIFQGKGHANEALSAILDLLFRRLGKHRVFASVDPRNSKSMALMERVGMRKEGYFRQSIWFKDAWADDVVFAMLNSDWS